jgi:hypothetical protein
MKSTLYTYRVEQDGQVTEEEVCANSDYEAEDLINEAFPDADKTKLLWQESAKLNQPYETFD